jgi:imidazolonepropionase-like amidohydrolase
MSRTHRIMGPAGRMGTASRMGTAARLAVIALPALAAPIAVAVPAPPAAAPAAVAAAPAVVALRAARVLDVERGVLLQDGVVVVEGDRIRSVGRAPAPAGATVIDLGDMTLLPGLIDVHTHLTFDLEGDWVNQPVKEGAADYALRGARNARRTLLAGFTTVRDVGAFGFADVALARAIEGGLVEGPRMVPSGHALGITGGHCDVTGFAPGILEQGPKQGVADGVDEVLKAVRYQIKHGARVIKTCATAGVSSFEESAGARQYSDAELLAMVEEAGRHGIKVAAHAHGTEGILAAVRAGAASIEHGSMLDDEAIRLMKERGAYLVPTLYTWSVPVELPPLIHRKNEEMKPHVGRSVRAAIKAGVRIALGTDAGTFPHGDNARELAALVEHGLSPLGAIRAATLHAAALLGTPDRGAITPGRLADLVAVPGDPLENVRVLESVRFVMKGGRAIARP